MMTKPLRVSIIKWSNPLARGLVSFIPFNEMAGMAKNLVSNQKATSMGTAAWSSAGILLGLNVTGPTIPFVNAISSDYTFLCCVVPAVNTGAGYGLGSFIAANTASISLGGNTSGFLVRATGQADWTPPHPVFAVNTQHVVGLRQSGQEHSAIYDGSITGSRTITPTAYSGATGNVFCGQNAGVTASGQRVWSALWNRALSPAEIASMSINPYQLIAQSSPSRLMRMLTQVQTFTGVSRARSVYGLGGISRGRM